MLDSFSPFFSGCRPRCKIDKFQITGLITELFMHSVRHCTVRMTGINVPGIDQRKICRLFGKSSGFVDMSSHDLRGPRLGDRDQIGDFLQSLVIIFGLEGDFCSSAVDLAAVGEVTVFTSPADGTCSKFHRCNLLFS